MRNLLFIIAILLTILSSCGKDEFRLSPEQLKLRATSAANDNNQIISVSEEILDITAEILADEGISNGRSFSGGRISGRACDPAIDHSYLIDRTHYDTILYVGTMTIDYGSGESCSDSEVRRGKVVDNFLYVLNTKMEVFSSKETVTFENYVKDTIQVDGEMVITSNTDSPVKVEFDQAKITYLDGTFVTWRGVLNFVSRNLNPQTGTSGYKNISGSIEGLTRRKETFTAAITTPIEYNYECTNVIPVSGTLELNVNSEPSTVEYGNGNCDNTYIVSVDGSNTEKDF